jgi:hypothetical protein
VFRILFVKIDLNETRTRTNVNISTNSLTGLAEMQKNHQERLQLIELHDTLLKKLVSDCINAKVGSKFHYFLKTMNQTGKK